MPGRAQVRSHLSTPVLTLRAGRGGGSMMGHKFRSHLGRAAATQLQLTPARLDTGLNQRDQNSGASSDIT